jgi:hypothetical protein
MSDTTEHAPAAPEAAAPAQPTFSSLFSQLLTKLEAAVPSVAGLEALWAAHQARGHLYDDERKKLAEMHDAVGTSATKTASASAPGASAPSVTATATASAKPESTKPEEAKSESTGHEWSRPEGAPPPKHSSPTPFSSDTHSSDSSSPGPSQE